MSHNMHKTLIKVKLTSPFDDERKYKINHTFKRKKKQKCCLYSNFLHRISTDTHIDGSHGVIKKIPKKPPTHLLVSILWPSCEKCCLYTQHC